MFNVCVYPVCCVWRPATVLHELSCVSEKTSEVKSCCGVGVLIGLWFSGVLTVAATLALSVAAKCIRKHKKGESE